MRSPCDALAPLSAFNQFVLYVARPDPDKPGKNKKYPVNPDGIKIDCHDPNYWMDMGTALRLVASKPENWGVAFVLTAADPFFFIDIDSALGPNDVWSPMAQDLCAAFAGCAVEVSNSGKGLHIIGAGIAPPHGCRNKSFNLEFYTERRFIALTGTHAQGSAGFSARPECLQWLVEQFFPFTEKNDFEGWTDGPVEEWSGPKDDSELLRRAMASRSAAGVFGAKATFADLWTCNVEVLAKCYPPDPSSNYPYNASQVDSALVAHLAFWTGRDCERMRRLMLESALVRPKWEDRDDYLERTILAACSVNKDVLTDKAMEPPAITVAAPVMEQAPLSTQEARLIEGSTFVSPEQQLEMWRGHVYVRDQNSIFVPHGGGEIMGPSAFNAAYGGYHFIMTRDNGAKEKEAFKAFTQSHAVRQLQAASTCFRPLLPPGSIVQEDGRDLVNIYMPVSTPRLVGDAMPFWRHMELQLPDARDRQILMSYLAACVQHKGVKFQWAPLLQGVEGNGKTFFTRCVAFAIGRKYTHWPKASKLAAQFNGWMYGKLFYGVEDIYTPHKKSEVIEELKPMITGDQLEIEGKGADQITRDICGNFLFNSNHKDAVRKGAGDRRFCIFYTAQQEVGDLALQGMDSAYMSKLYRWCKGEGEYAQYGANYGYRIVNELLSTWPIPAEFNPAGSCQRAPATSSTAEVIEHSRSPLEAEIMEAIEEQRPGFAGGFISSQYLKFMFEEMRITIGPARRDLILAGMGYIKHPGLTNGRVNNIVKPDMARTILYVKPNHPSCNLAPSTIAECYSVAQSGQPVKYPLT